MELEFTDRILVGIVTDSAGLRNAIEANLDYVRNETLTVTLTFEPVPGAEGIDLKVGENALTLFVTTAAGDA
jgi:isoleucyl-tRNA synthetase